MQILLCTSCLCLNAQDSLFKLIPLNDSITVNDDSYFIYNSIKISNAGIEKKDVVLTIKAQIGWRIVSDTVQKISISGKDSILFPVTISKTKYSSSIWTEVQVQVLSLDNSSLVSCKFAIRAQDRYLFSLKSAATEILLAENQNSFLFPFVLKNEGNSKQDYKIVYRNSVYGLFKNFKCTLNPGQDTTFVREIEWPQRLAIGKIGLQVEVSDTTGQSKVILCNLFKEKSTTKIHKSKHEFIPFDIETGYFKLDRQLSYYIGVSAAINLKKSVLDFKFRSKTLGIANTVERNVFVSNWQSKKMKISLGQLSDFSSFYSYGPGISMIFKPTSDFKMGIQFIGKNDKIVYTGNNFSSFVSYGNKKTIVTHSLIFNQDYNRELASWLQKNDFVFKNTENYKLSINFNIGLEKRLGIWLKAYKPGIAMGYKFYKQLSDFIFQSNFQKNQSNYPGVDKGLFTQFHALNWQKKNFTLGGFFQYNKTISTIFRDTIFQADISYFNNRKFGIRYSQFNSFNSFSIASGWYRQLGQMGFLVPKYLFTDLSFSRSARSGVKVQFSSMNGMSNRYKSNSVLHFTSSSLTLGYKKVGIKGFYIQNPIFFDREGKLWSGYTKTMLLGGYFGFNFFKYFSSHFSGTVSKSLYDQRKASSVSINLRYNNSRRNLQMEWSGNIPIVKSNAPGILGSSFPSYTFSLRKTFNVPNIFKKTYQHLRVAAYNDINQNYLKDEGEVVLPGIDLLIGNLPMKTDSFGVAKYLNADTGIYKVRMLSANPVPGLTPLFGREISVDLKKDTVVFLPFRKSSVIKGRVIVTRDSFSTSNLMLDNIRITAKDSIGHEFATLTNKNGDYYLELPASNYTVSLNPFAFGDAVKPEQYMYVVDLSKVSMVTVDFTLLERRRAVRVLKK